MKVSLKLLLGVSAFSTLACAPKVVTPPAPAAATVVDQSRAFERHLTHRMREAFAEQEVPETLARSPKDVAFLTRGGEPGPVTLEGAFVSANGSAVPQVKFDLTYGYGRNGRLPKVPAARPILLSRVSDESRSQLDADKNRQNYTLLGCIFSGPEKTGTLHERGYKKAPMMTVDVKLVQICGDPKLDFFSLHIVADRLVIKDMDFNLTGLVSRRLSIVAKEIVILGTNKITTTAPDDELTYAPGPSVVLSAEKISGDGQILIKATGANFVKR